MPSASLSIVAVEFSYGGSEAWGFQSPEHAMKFLEALEWHPGVRLTESQSDRRGFTFAYETVEGHTAKFDPTANAVPLDTSEWSEQNTHGDFDTTAFPMGGVPVRLVNPVPTQVIPRRLRRIGVDTIH